MCGMRGCVGLRKSLYEEINQRLAALARAGLTGLAALPASAPAVSAALRGILSYRLARVVHAQQQASEARSTSRDVGRASSFPLSHKRRARRRGVAASTRSAAQALLRSQAHGIAMAPG